jgi:hypothetical protein
MANIFAQANEAGNVLLLDCQYLLRASGVTQIALTYFK